MKLLVATLLVVSCLILVSCAQVDTTAPLGSELTLTAQPNGINTNDSATLTVRGTRGTGAPLPDDTVIHFTVDQSLGTVTPNPVKTKDGIAIATFHAGARSGTVTVTASSGDATAETEIGIGQSRASNLVLTAEPASLPVGGGRTKLRAFVFDEDGNPLPQIPVFFTTDAGTLDSRGQSVLTNGSGLATDTLRTDESAQVSAEVAVDGVSSTVTVEVTEGEPVTCNFTVSPTGTVGVGETVFFFDSSDDPDGNIRRSSWDFGDGSDANGLSVSHSYDEPGSYVVTHEVVDDQGISDVCEPVTVEVDFGEPPTCSFVSAPTGTINVGDRVSFVDTSTDSDGFIEDFDWEFGDGARASGQNPSHVYNESGSFLVLHTVTDDQGLSSTCTPIEIVVEGTSEGPICSFTAEPTSVGSCLFSFDASASEDSDENGVSITNFEFDFGDGTSTSSGNPVASHDYTTRGPGNFTISLTITDDESETSNCSNVISVPDCTP